MLVRRVRRRPFAVVSSQTKAALETKLAGTPQLDVLVGEADQIDIQAFSSAWNKVQAKCKQAGIEGALDGVRVLVADEGRYTAKFAKGRLTVNLTKFSKNAMAAELLAHELGRRFWSTNLTDSQRKSIQAKVKDPEGYFAKKFRAKLFSKPKAERWEAVQL